VTRVTVGAGPRLLAPTPARPRRSIGASFARMLIAAGAIALALFGSFLLVLTPSLGAHPGLQTLWVLVSLVLLKLPLLFLVWWIIVRRRSRAGRSWTHEETAAFLTRVSEDVSRSTCAPDADVRLARLRDEVWAAVAQADPDSTQALVDLALGIERLEHRTRPRSRSNLA
jgi:hypothetical protein